MVEQLLEGSLEGADYDSGLYESVEVAPCVDGFANVTEAGIARFNRDGFLSVSGAFSKKQAADALDAVLDIIDHKDPDFRHLQFERGMRKRASAGSTLRREGVRKLRQFVGSDARLDLFATCPDLLSVLRRIFGKPPKLYRHQALMKPARIGREKPWHQDHAYFNIPMGTCIVSVWIALEKATPENGCMHVIPGSHREGPVVHFKRRDWQICDTHVARNRVVAVPLEPGSILFWHGLLHHGTPANKSDHSRRSLQLHFMPEGVDETPTGDRLAVFGNEGKDVTC